jgi:serine/threonine-protein kinase
MKSITEALKVALADRYVIEEEVGAGGMATVYLAHDVKHDRKVALKVLRPELAAVIGAERFLNEIKVTANLQHPHILPLHDSGEADTFLYYVMPFVEGDTLRDKLDREKQLGIDDAVEITRGVAAALDYAHRQGVIHRDIKPENVLIHDGQPLVADFGIALAVSAAGGSRLTETGLSVGTPHYMSPEQAMGDRELDARSDVYSLGAMLYEMLSGDPPHTGSTAQAIVAQILTEDPRPLTRSRKTVPPHVAAAVQQALQKLAADRFGSAAEFATALTNAGFTGAATLADAPTAAAGAEHRRWRGAALGLGAAAVVLAIAAVWGWLRSEPRPVVRVSMAFPEDEAPAPAATHRFAISRDGSRIVYTGPSAASMQQLWLRELDDLHARPLPGTEGAQAPFFSPDGRIVGFFAGRPGDLRVIPIDGGPPQTIVADSANPWGGTWAPDGMVYFAIGSGELARVPAGGGAVERLSVLDTTRNDREHNFPDVLPDGKRALIQVFRGSAGSTDIGIVSFETGEARVLTQGIYARYLHPNRILYGTQDGTLLLAPFDPELMELTSPGVALLDGVRVENFSISPQVALSPSGTLLYQEGVGANSEQTVWVELDGTEQPVDSTWRGDFSSMALSPDGSLLAVSLYAGAGDESIWVKRLDAGPLTRLTFEGSNNYRPAWAPDGRSIAFISNRSGEYQAWIKRADGSAAAQLLLEDERQIDEVVWSRDGRWLVYRTGSGGTNTRDIQAIRPGVDSVPQLVAGSPFDEYSPAVSPDGRWVAYVSTESGRPEVYVRPFPDADRAKWQVSVDGASEPVWSQGGGRLFFRTRRGDIAAVEIGAGAGFQAGAPQLLFSSVSTEGESYHQTYDITADGRRLIMLRQEKSAETNVVLVLNWTEELKERTGR